MKLTILSPLIATTILALPVLAGAPDIDKWGLNESSDPMSDTRIVTAGVGTTDGMILQFQCSGDKFGAVIVPFEPMVKFEFITMDEQTEVVWRIDSQPAVTESWHVLAGKAGSAYVVVTLSADAFARAILAGGDKIAFRVHGLTTSVTLEGASDYVMTAMRACGIEP